MKPQQSQVSQVSQMSQVSQETNIQVLGHILEGQTLNKQGHEVRVTVLQGGQSKNGFVYDEATLQQLAPMLEGAQAYADHDTSASVRSVRDMVGFYTQATYVPPIVRGQGERNDTTSSGRVDATLHILEAADWLWSMIYEAVSIGKPDLVGLSIDIFGQWIPVPQTGSQDTKSAAKHVTAIRSINSCDIVTRPSAGGSFQRILHSEQQSHSFPSCSPCPQVMPANMTPGRPHGSSLHLNQGDSTFMDPTTTTTTSLVTSPVAPPVSASNGDETPPPAGNIPPQRMQEQQQSQQDVQSLLHQLQLERAQLALERRLLESVLPQAVLQPLRERYSGRIFEMTDLERDLTASQQMMAALASSGIIRGNGYEKPVIGQQITEAEKVQAAFDLMFEDDRVKMLSDAERTRFAGIRPFTSIREAYARATGDPAVTGAGSGSLGMIRVSEHAPIGRITEADTTTASFSYLLGTSMNKRLLKDYQAWPAEWMRFCTITPIKDFKQQTRVRLGAFGSLSTVAEDTAYSTISLQDTAATYVPTKRGNLVTVSREAIVNDDLFAIKQIPTKLAVAAAYTLAEFVYAFLSSNPNIYDGNALFTSGAPHSNLGSSALSTTAMQTGVTAMREQTNFAGKRIGLRPRYLIVPPELEFTAMVVTKSAGVPGSNNNDINPMLGYVTPIVAPQLTNTSQWFFAADPNVVDTIEVGFVGGQVNPALFIQDQPLFGLNFTQDVVSYKIRHEYGGCAVDYRGLYRGI